MERTRYFNALAAFVAWLVFCIAAFWYFQFRHIGALSKYNSSYAGFMEAQLSQLSVPENMSAPLVIHFIDPACPCSKFSEPHKKKLENRFASRAVFAHWQAIDLSPTLAREMRSIQIPAGPAVAIWNHMGELAYFGPYSSGAYCGKGNDFVSETLIKLREGKNPRWVNNDALGCFCPWKNEVIQLYES